MASDADKLRSVAAELRKEAAVIEHDKMVKVGRILQASVGLKLLAEKVRHNG